jgi:hypothetical protein
MLVHTESTEITETEKYAGGAFFSSASAFAVLSV